MRRESMTTRIAITPGEPAGIGPELAVMLAQRPRDARLVAVCDPALLAARAAALALPLELLPDDGGATPDAPGTLRVCEIGLAAPSLPGRLDARNVPYVLATLDAAIDGCVDRRYDAMVTGPVHKAVIADAGIPFTGHTEYLAARTSVDEVLMVLAADAFRVALVTTHLPLAEVASAVTVERVTRTLELLVEGLRARYGVSSPRVLVAGLNPHAGEEGLLGREEIEVIGPVCDAFRARGLDIVGPLPADTLFTPDRVAGADAVLAMYHDQGLPVLKYAGFGKAVNVTFGLPIIRTSVDHGTALDIAGRGVATVGSLEAAVAAAQQMIGFNGGAA